MDICRVLDTFDVLIASPPQSIDDAAAQHELQFYVFRTTRNPYDPKAAIEGAIVDARSRRTHRRAPDRSHLHEHEARSSKLSDHRLRQPVRINRQLTGVLERADRKSLRSLVFAAPVELPFAQSFDNSKPFSGLSVKAWLMSVERAADPRRDDARRVRHLRNFGPVKCLCVGSDYHLGA